MNILKVSTPQKNEIELTIGKWVMPYYVGTFVELKNSVIVCYDWDEIKVNPPEPEFYHGCTIWCYNKNDKSIKWIIEEPPLAYTNGKLWNRGQVLIYGVSINRDECYSGISGHIGHEFLYAHTTGARAFKVDPDTGKVTLTATGLR